MSEFPEIQPFGPRPVQPNEDVKNEAKSVSPPESVNYPSVSPPQSRTSIGLVISALGCRVRSGLCDLALSAFVFPPE